LHPQRRHPGSANAGRGGAVPRRAERHRECRGRAPPGGRPMTLKAFQQRVRRQFGPGMEQATPQNIREFLDEMQQELATTPIGGRYELAETAVSYEAIQRSFFSDILEAPRDQALSQLWMLGLEFAFADLRDILEEEVSPLFSPWEEPL